MLMNILNYLDFILENNQKPLLPIVFSEEFMDRLYSIGNSFVSSYLKTLSRRDDATGEYTLISIGKNDDSLSYTDSYKLKDFSGDLRKIKSDSDLWKKNRTDIKIGRFVKKLFPDTFTDKAVEDFVNKWKSVGIDDSKFDIWSGERIVDGYKSSNYEREIGTLGNSCMNDENWLVSFYSFCPTAKLLVLLNSNDKILARALLWEDHEGRKIMDRVYYIEDKHYYKFIRWADENEYFYKKSNFGSNQFVKNGVIHSLKSKVRIPNCFEFSEDGFPFLDTYQYGVGDWAQNFEPDDVKRYFIFNQTDGTFQEETFDEDIYGNIITDPENFVWSKTQGGFIDIDKSFKVEYKGFDDWIEVEYLDDPKNGFVKSDGLYYKKSDCVFSKSEDKWIWKAWAEEVDGDWKSIW
jgi:hypothetical protein